MLSSGQRRSLFARLARWRGALLVGALALGACTARHKVDGDLVRSVQFSGNNHSPISGHNDSNLRSQMEMRDSAWGVTTFPLLFFVPPVAYVEHRF